MLKTFRYKLVPNKKQKVLLSQTLDVCRELYNIGLEQRRCQRISEYDQIRQLTELRTLKEYKSVHVHVLQNVIKKLNRSFENFFRRCKKGGKPGFPRFKGKDRYDSFQFNNTGFLLEGNRLKLSKIGNVKVRLSRELPKDSVIKTCSIKRSVSGWFAMITFEYKPALLPKSDLSIGIDVGIENFAALSDGTMIPNPRFYECGQVELRKAQRKVARRTKGSHGRRKAINLLSKVYERIANRRNNFLHKETTKLVAKFGVIAVEKLNVKCLAQGILSKQVHDASWATFFNFLSYKAAEAGRELIEVGAKYTSQTCPMCGGKKKKSLSERKHECQCGYSTHRDTAAAQVILSRAGQTRRALTSGDLAYA